MNTMEQPVGTENIEKKKSSNPNEYSIADYFKEHTGLAVTCISAVVAVTSFVLNYAIALQNAAYMHYWNINTAYVAGNDGIQFYVVFAAFVYSIIIVLVHALLSKTADVYRHDNVIASRGKVVYKELRKHLNRLKKEQKKYEKKLKAVCYQKEREEIQLQLDDILKDVDLHEKIVPETLSAINGVKKRIAGHIILSFIISLVISVFGVVVFSITIAEQLEVKTTVLVSIPILVLDAILYFIPAYIATRPKKIKDTDIVDMAYELIDGKTPMFPMESLVRKGVKVIVSDRNIKMMLVQYITTIVVCLILFSQIGTTSAKSAKEFPIYTDETGTYAVVYNNGYALVLKAANINDTQIDIDVRQQKVISATDVSYEICTFETVIVTGKDGGK